LEEPIHGKRWGWTSGLAVWVAPHNSPARAPGQGHRVEHAAVHAHVAPADAVLDQRYIGLEPLGDWNLSDEVTSSRLTASKDVSRREARQHCRPSCRRAPLPPRSQWIRLHPSRWRSIRAILSYGRRRRDLHRQTSRLG
jgi:hypothetical protein